MNQAESTVEQLFDASSEFWNTVSGFLPELLAALVLLILALVVARLVQTIVERGLTYLGVNKVAKNKTVSSTLRLSDVNVDLVELAGRTMFWVVMIIFALTIADVLGLTAMRDVIREILSYLPNVLAAIIVLTITVAGARLLKDVIAAALTRMQIDYAGPISSVAFYVLVIFGTVMAVDQLGFDTTILSANITVIVAGIMLALALAFGLGGRDTAGKIVDNTYNHMRKLNKKR